MENKNYKMIEYYYKNYGKKRQELKSQKEYTDKNYIIECLGYAIMENQEITMVYSKSGNKDLSDMQLYGILKDFNYGSDKINFNRVDLDEVRFGLTEK